MRFRSMLGLCVGAVITIPVLGAVLYLPGDQARRIRGWVFDADQITTVMLAEAVGPALDFYDLDPKHLETTLVPARRHPDLLYVRVFAQDGRELSRFGIAHDNSGAGVDLDHDRRPAEVIGDVLHIRRPVFAAGRPVGSIRAGFSTGAIRRGMESYRIAIVALGVLVIAGAMGMAWSLGVVLARPLERLGQAMKSIGGGRPAAGRSPSSWPTTTRTIA